MYERQLVGKLASETVADIITRRPTTGLDSEDIRIRNFDGSRSYLVRLRVTDVDGMPALERTYDMPPVSTACVVNELEDGCYGIAVTVDDDRHDLTSCRIDDRSEHTVLVETGNGAVSVTAGTD